jgi:excisionase family DNA binding protein
MQYVGRVMHAINANTPGLTANASPDELLEKPETASRLKVSKRTLDAWMRDGRVPFLKIGKTVRFRWPEVVAHLENKNRIN